MQTTIKCDATKCIWNHNEECECQTLNLKIENVESLKGRQVTCHTYQPLRNADIYLDDNGIPLKIVVRE